MSDPRHVKAVERMRNAFSAFEDAVAQAVYIYNDEVSDYNDVVTEIASDMGVPYWEPIEDTFLEPDTTERGLENIFEEHAKLEPEVEE